MAALIYFTSLTGLGAAFYAARLAIFRHFHPNGIEQEEIQS